MEIIWFQIFTKHHHRKKNNFKNKSIVELNWNYIYVKFNSLFIHFQISSQILKDNILKLRMH